MADIRIEELHKWCSIPADKLQKHPELKIPFRMVKDSAEMGEVMADELIAVVEKNNAAGKGTRAIVPCGPKAWYEPFTRKVNSKKVSLKNLVVFHMDECLDWQGKPLKKNNPYNFRTFMEIWFYNPVKKELAVEEKNRHWMTPESYIKVSESALKEPIDITLGGWGQDGHMAYNQARRNPYSRLTVEQLMESTARMQDNNMDTIFALANRTFGSAYQFVPPMSVTIGIKECMSAKKVRIFSDTGAWKQTALRVALFSQPTVEYPMTLLQKHPDALITATRETASHPISENPEWELL